MDKAAALGEAGNVSTDVCLVIDTHSSTLMKKDPLMVYQTAKTLAERAAWDFVEQHPHVEFTSSQLVLFLCLATISDLPSSVNPPILYGPLAPGYRNPDAKISALSSNSFLYDLLRRDGPAPISPAYLDVRDAARALVNALDSAPTAEVGPKRIVLSGEWFSAKDAVEYIAQSRPELADRLSDAAKSAPPAPPTPVDNTRAKEILKLEITDWKVSVIDGVDDLLKLEAEWKAKGLTPK